MTIAQGRAGKRCMKSSKEKTPGGHSLAIVKKYRRGVRHAPQAGDHRIGHDFAGPGESHVLAVVTGQSGFNVPSRIISTVNESAYGLFV